MKDWRVAFEAGPAHDDKDTRLYEMGMWTFKKLEAIRRKLPPLWPTGFSRRELIEMYVGAANRDYQVLADRTRNAQNVLIAEQITQAKLQDLALYGGSADPDSFIISRVDGLRFPLQKIFNETQKQTLDRPSDAEALDKVRISTVLGQLYNIIEGHWMQALWEGWHLEPTGRDDIDLIRPPEDLLPIIAAASEYRRSSLMIELAFHFMREWKYLITEEGKRVLLSMLPRVQIQTSGSWSPAVSRTLSDVESEDLLQNRLIAEQAYYEKLAHEPIKTLTPITLHTLLQAWEVLYAMSEELMRKMPSASDSGVDAIEKLMRYAPTLRKIDVISIIKEWCRVPTDQAVRIIDFFTYCGGSKWELWGHPLVELNNEEVVPLFAPILAGNMQRTYELWMKDGEFEMTEKGFLFEDYARAELQMALDRSSQLKDAEILPNRLKLIGTEGEEEIDIVIRIGNVVMLGEAKCLLFPADPLDRANYFDVLKDAANQVTRKAEFANLNRARLAQHLQLRQVDPTLLEVHPFVLLNQPYGVGFPIKGVPVIDDLILERFFEGEYHRMVTPNESGRLEAQAILKLYSNENDAANRIIDYLNDPPQISHYKEFIKTSVHQYPRIDEEDRGLAVAHLEVILPLPELSL